MHDDNPLLFILDRYVAMYTPIPFWNVFMWIVQLPLIHRVDSSEVVEKFVSGWRAFGILAINVLPEG